MYKLRLKYLTCLILGLFIAPACRKKASSVETTKIKGSMTVPQKSLSVFDSDLEAFTIDEEESPFGPQKGLVLMDEIDGSENDMFNEHSRDGFMPIYFEFDADCTKPGQNGAMENNLARAKKLTAQGKKIVIEGHACKFAGSSEYNMHLSEKRAQCVYKYFIESGIPKEKITVVGRGNEMCVVPSGNKEQQAPNRRVEFVAVTVEQKQFE